MKPKTIIPLVILVAAGAFAAYLLAQPGRPVAAPSQLDEAISLLAEGKAQQAKELLVAIEAGDPSYDAAQRYHALCLYELKDYLGFLKATEALEINSPVVAPEAQEELAFGQIEALFHFRKFEDIFPKIQAFQMERPGSARLDAVTEYQLAALFERGMKKTYEAVRLQDQEKFNARWTEGKANLEEFLSLAATFPATNYSQFPKRALKEDIWAARMTLGEEEAVFAEVTSSNATQRERLSLVRLRVYQKLYFEQVDRLLELMDGFVSGFPDSTNRFRIEYELADLSFEVAERAWLDLSKSDNDSANQSSDKWGVIMRYNARGREVAGPLLHKHRSGLAQQDYLHLCQDYLNSYFEEADYQKLASEAAALLGDYEAGSLGWVMGRIYEAVLLARQTPPRLSEADRLFEQVMSLGFRNKTSFDQWITCAAKWRVYLAVANGDRAKAETVAAWVEDGNCNKELKQDFGKKYQLLVGTAN